MENLPIEFTYRNKLRKAFVSVMTKHSPPLYVVKFTDVDLILESGHAAEVFVKWALLDQTGAIIENVSDLHLCVAEALNKEFPH